MRYKIVYTEASEQDLVSIYNYIAMDLLVPETAKNQVNRLMKAIKGLDELPLRHKRYHEEPLRSKGLRVFPVDNYLVFYTATEEEMTVDIIRIMYAGRNLDLQWANKKSID